MTGRTKRIAGVLAVAATAALVVQTEGCGLLYSGRIAAPPAVPFMHDVDSVGRSVVLNYARGLAYDTVTGAGDYQRLAVGVNCDSAACAYGTHARIEPQVNAAGISDTDALAHGAVIARILRVDSIYPKLNLRPNDTTYWWVDKRYGQWRMRLILSDTSYAPVSDTLDYHVAVVGKDHWKQSISRFLWRARDEGLWTTCTMYGCCKTRGM